MQIKKSGPLKRSLIPTTVGYFLLVVTLLSACGGSSGGESTPTVAPTACAASSTPPNAEPNGSQVVWQVKPSAASSCVSTYDDPSQVYLDTSVAKKGLLAIFLPGTGGLPSQFPSFLQRGAARGYHMIGLSYPNPQSISDVCDAGDGDASCAGLAREEVLTGKDTSPLLSITPDNSIEARLVALLKYLALHRPSDGWGQFLDAQGAIVWDKVSVSGNSQGAGHAGYIGKLRRAYRVGMYAGPSDWVKKTNQAPNWFSQMSLTPTSSYYGYIHIPDSIANRSGNPNQVTTAWGAGTMFNMSGALTNTAGGSGTQNPVFGASQRLTTSACSALDTTNQHNCPMFKGNEPVWDYVSFP
jgi:hypothetical protein